MERFLLETRKIASLTTVAVLISVLFMGTGGVSGGTSPFTNAWVGYTPSIMANLNDVLSISDQDSTGNAEVSFAVALDRVIPPYGDAEYYGVDFTTTLFAHCTGKVTYGATPGTYNAQFWRGGIYGILGSDNGGRWVQFPAHTYFPYYGAWYDRVFVSANGFIILGQIGATDTDQETEYTTKTPSATYPNVLNPNGVIAPLWRDLNPAQYGTIRYGWYTLGGYDTFVVAWDGVKNYANSNLQSFAVWLQPAIGWITFVYKTLTKDVPTTVGIENPFGTAGIGDLYSQVSIPTLDVMTTLDFSPSQYNKWQVSDVRVFAKKTVSSGANDVDASIDISGTSDLKWGGLNVRLYNPGPAYPPPDFNDRTHRIIQRVVDEGIGQLAGLTVIPGAIWDGYNFVRDIDDILSDYKYTYETTKQEPGREATFPAMAENLPENTMQVSRGDPSDKVFSLWTAPVFHWTLYDAGELAANDHTIAFSAQVDFLTWNGQLVRVTTSEDLKFTVFKNGRSGLQCAFYDNFDDGFIQDPTLNPGSLEDWSVSTGSQGSVSLSSDESVYSEAYSLYIHHPAGSTGRARVTSPHLSVNFQLDYSIVVYVNVASSGLGSGLHLIVADDGRLEVFIRNAAGVGPQISVATSSGGYIDDRAVPGGQWHMIVIKAFPSIGKFKLYVDGQGGFVDYNFKSSTGVDTITMGSVLSPGSRDGGDAQFDDIAVYGYLLPHPDLLVDGSVSRTEVTAPGEVVFSCSPSGGLTPYEYKWSFGDATTSTEMNPVHSYSSSGTYQAVVTVTDASRDTAQWQSPVITVAPPLSVEGVASPPSGVCPLTVSFTSIVSGGASPYSYSWTFGDGSTGTGSTTSHVYNAAGTYAAVLAVTDNNDATATDTIPITVTNPPVNQKPVAMITGPSWAIVSETTNFDGSDSYDPDGTVVAYICLFGDGGGESGTMPPATITHAYSLPGTYTVTLRVQDDDGAWSDDATISIAIYLPTPPSWLLWDDFLDGNTVGWTLTQSGGTATVDTGNGLPAAPSMKLVKSARGETSAKRSFTTQYWSVVLAHANMMASTASKNKWCVFELYNGATLEAAFGFINGNMCYYKGKAGWTSINAPYSAGVWYDILLDLKVGSGFYNIYVNGLVKMSGIPLLKSPYAIDTVKFRAGESSHTGLTMWVDDVLIRSTTDKLFYDAFSDDLSDWILTGGGTARDTTIGSPLAPSMKASATSSSGTQYANHTFASQTGRLVVEERVRVVGPGNFYVTVGSSVYLCFQPGFVIWCWNGGWQMLDTCNANQWYSLVLVVDVNLQVYDVYIDGKLCAVDARFYEQASSISQFGYIVFKPSSGTIALWADDIVVYYSS